MGTSTRDIFSTIKTEGAVLPADLIRRLADGDKDVGGLTPGDYHLAQTERLNEAATRAWNRLQGAWGGFKSSADKLPEFDTGTTLTRERWLLILFQELGYGRLTARKAYEIGGKTYAISHTWQNTPIHLVAFRQELDHRTPGARGAARVSPHSLVQEFLNRSDDHLWGFVSNGLTLRILRDNVSLTRQAYVEFDLAAMMDGEAYSDFFLLFLLCHQSRVEVPEGKTPEHCWLEKWYNTAATEGVRALDQLRQGVQEAIQVLGGGFLAHPANGGLREKLRQGAEGGGLSTLDYYRQILRQVYRLLFLFVAEDRGLLLSPDAPVPAGQLYCDHYSTESLRTLAGKRRGTRHPDLFRALRLVIEKLRTGCPQLGLPALGSYLFSTEATPDLDDADIANSDLLTAVRHLAFTVDKNVLRPVNYRNLGSEELGSVYESLLEMHPEINVDAGAFALNVAAGSERKTTGSYYTPSSLVNCLLDSALAPVLDEACKADDPEQALLDLKICDPACGSGHFLIAAAHRLAKRLAAVRAGEEEPAPQSVQHALRDVIGRCIYGVDINPMAVELCKINLWMEAIEPGKPLTFLDHHIQCGNSLLGATPALIRKGIPDAAFKPIEGDVKSVCTQLRKENKAECKGQRRLWGAMPAIRLGDLTQTFANLDVEDDSTLDAVAAKEKHYHELVSSAPYENARLLADAWCAAFVWPKINPHDPAITTETIRRIEDNPHEFPEGSTVRERVRTLANQYQFFHWHLVFPDVFRVPAEGDKPEDEHAGWSGGFDCVLGNPPWEKIQTEELQFFAVMAPEIVDMKGARRKAAIKELTESQPALAKAWDAQRRLDAATASFIRWSGTFPLTGVGKFNSFALFAELKRNVVGSTGRIGCIVPSGIATDATTQYFFQDLVETRSLVSLYDFENGKPLFPAVDRRFKFCLITLAGPARPHMQADFVFFAREVEDLSELDRHFSLSADDVTLLNPNTRTCPIFRGKPDAELTKYAYRRAPALEIDGVDNPWRPSLRRILNETDDSPELRTLAELGVEDTGHCGTSLIDESDTEWLRFYEAKLAWHYDHRYATYDGASNDAPSSVSALEHRDADFLVRPQYWYPVHLLRHRYQDSPVPEWSLVFRRITNVTNERTMVFTIVPRVALGTLLPTATLDASPENVASFLAEKNSFAFDYIARQKISGTDVNLFKMKQLPSLTPHTYQQQCPWNDRPMASWLCARVIEMTDTAVDIEAFARSCSYDGPSFVWDEERRFLIRCELDAAFFHLYLGSESDWRESGSKELLEYFPTPRRAVEYIMETFPIVKRKDEQAHGRYRTKDTILGIYDEMAEAIAANEAARAAGQPATVQYRTRLDPPPGPPTDSDGNFIPMAQWNPANWPPHIHPPRP